jgi:glycosyltransferase involved in cell wall biosynthesis
MSTALLPKITVVTPCFNSIVTIRETLQNVRDQDYKNVEHLVFDGGSQDGTLDILREFPHLKWVSEKDEGHYHAMHKGLMAATGDVVAVLNADDTYPPGTLRAVAEAFAAHPDWDGLFGDLLFVDAKGEKICNHTDACFDYDVLRYWGCYVVHPTLFIKKRVYTDLNGFRYKEFKNLCDFDLLLRIGRAKYRIGHLRRILAHYRFHEFGQSADLRIRANSTRERLILKREHGCPDGFAGKVMTVYGRLRRQFQKLILRGRPDFVSGHYYIKKHYLTEAKFSSNIGLDKLEK